METELWYCDLLQLLVLLVILCELLSLNKQMGRNSLDFQRLNEQHTHTVAHFSEGVEYHND